MPSRNHLSACLCFKDAASYLAEWLAFYATLGVGHFYLYDNESVDDVDAVVAPYVSAGRVTLIAAPGRAVQYDAYAHCLATFGSRTRWLMFCDDDEFLFPVRDISLPAALEPYERQAGVAVAWMLYGSSGHWQRPRGWVIENYAMRAAVPDHHVKCIVDPSRVRRPLLIGHQFECVAGEHIVDECGEPMTGPLHPNPTAAVFRINHYLTKSRVELTARRQRIQANTGEVSSLSLPQWIELEANWNQVRDPVAARYGDRMRTHASAMAGRAAADSTAAGRGLRLR